MEQPTIAIDPADSLLLKPGQRLGSYEIIEPIGAGASGQVYKARHLLLGHFAAVKAIPTAQRTERERQRFREEARLLITLKHANIVTLYDFCCCEGIDCLLMEFVAGTTLRSMLAHGALPFRRAAGILAQIAQAVQCAHEHGIIHRDLKPENILIDSNGKPVVVDFGVAKNLARTVSLSNSGEVFGTPRYMAPEQITGNPRAVTASIDVYALGAIFYEMLSGHPAVAGKGDFEVVYNLTNTAIVSPLRHNKKIPRQLAAVCVKATQREAKERYATAAAMAAEVQAWLAKGGAHDKRLPHASPNVWVAAVVLFCAAAVWSFNLWFRHISAGKEAKTVAATKQPIAPATPQARTETDKPVPPSQPPPPKPEIHTPEYHIRRGDNAIQQGQVTEAINAYSLAIRLDGKCAEAFCKRGLAWLQLNETDKAWQDFSQAIVVDTAYAPAYFCRGRMLGDRGQYTAAIQEYNMVIGLCPDHYEAYAQRATCLCTTNQAFQPHLFDVAIEDCNRSLQIRPDYVFAYLVRGNCLFGKGDVDGAIGQYRQALRIDPNYVDAQASIASMLRCKRDYQAALRESEQALRMNPNFVFTYIVRIQIFGDQGDYQAARQELESFRQQFPQHPELATWQAYVEALKNKK